MSTWPQYTIITISILALVINILDAHVKKRSPLFTLIYLPMSAAYLYVLYAGGFWTSLGLAP